MQFKKNIKRNLFWLICIVIIFFILLVLSQNKIIAHKNSLFKNDPIEIDTLAKLQNINNNCAGNYKLTKDINGNGAGFTTLCSNGSGFTGEFDGQGHTISNLIIQPENENTTNAGLFGINSGQIENIHLNKIDMQADTYRLGGLIGSNNGTLKRCYITDSTIRGDSNLSQELGGLVGYNSSVGSITLSYTDAKSTVDIAAPNEYSQFIGGMVGENDGNIDNSYNRGTISCFCLTNINPSCKAGGIVGINKGAGTIEYTYNGGSIKGESNPNIWMLLGGLAGANSGTISSSYWDHTINSNIDVDGDGRTTEQMQPEEPTSNTYTNWDTAIWVFAKNNYPDFGHITISGKVYGAKEGVDVKLAIQGKYKKSVPTDSNGNFTFSKVNVFVNLGNTVLVYSSAEKGSALTLGIDPKSDITNLNIYPNIVALYSPETKVANQNLTISYQTLKTAKTNLKDNAFYTVDSQNFVHILASYLYMFMSSNNNIYLQGTINGRWDRPDWVAIINPLKKPHGEYIFNAYSYPLK